MKTQPFELMEQVQTTEEMRAEIWKLSRQDPLVHRVMEVAGLQGRSGEDCYTMLAYYALQEMLRLQQECYEQVKAAPLHCFKPGPTGQRCSLCGIDFSGVMGYACEIGRASWRERV